MNITGKRVEILRKMKSLTQTELAKKAGVSQSIITKIERGERKNPSANNLAKIASVLGVSIYDLIDEKLPSDKEMKQDFSSLCKEYGISEEFGEFVKKLMFMDKRERLLKALNEYFKKGKNEDES